MKMRKPECTVSLQTDHLLLTHCLGWCLRSFLWPASFSESEDAPYKPSSYNPQPPAPTFPCLFTLPCYWKQQNLGLLGEFLRRESICLYIIYLFTHWDMFSLPRHTRYVPTFSLQHVLQISSPPPLFPCFTLSVSCLREMLLTVNWKR